MPARLACLTALVITMAALSLPARPSAARPQVSDPKFTVVNIIPKSLSDETNQDSEPNLAVNPADPTQIAASAFTPAPDGGEGAPIFVSRDGGASWLLNNIVPSQGPIGTGDITIRFGTSSNTLYGGILSVPGNLKLKILRTSDFTGGEKMTALVERERVDQPYVQAITVAGKDRVYVGQNDFGSTGGRTATVERSLDAASATPPAGFKTARIETRTTSGQNGPQVRPAISADGTKVYGIFYGWRSFDPPSGKVKFDLIVVRDDNGGDGTAAFRALKDGDDDKAGVRVVKDRTIVWGATLGQDRVGGDPAIAVSPLNADEVYVAWSDHQGDVLTVHVRRSADAGKTWSADLVTVPRAKNPCLAVNNQGRVGLVYQKVETQGGQERWVTVFERSTDAFATKKAFVLANTPADSPDPQFLPYIGDYLHMMSVGQHFYGIFSANNTPNRANFPQGVPVYQRNHNFDQKKLLGVDGTSAVDESIDPFFFRVEEPS